LRDSSGRRIENINDLVNINTLDELLKAVVGAKRLIAKSKNLNLDETAASLLLQKTLRAPILSFLGKRTDIVKDKRTGDVRIVPFKTGGVFTAEAFSTIESILNVLGVDLEPLVTREE